MSTTDTCSVTCAAISAEALGRLTLDTHPSQAS